jgi:hypothetical protein
MWICICARSHESKLRLMTLLQGVGGGRAVLSRHSYERGSRKLLRFPLRMTRLPFALRLSKGLSEWAEGFDKAQLERR